MRMRRDQPAARGGRLSSIAATMRGGVPDGKPRRHTPLPVEGGRLHDIIRRHLMSLGYPLAMTAERRVRSAFPLRFENERTRELLRVVAEQQHMSMNQLAEEMIERELQVLALGLESNLSETIELLRAYRGEGRAEAWAEFADAEELPEPIAARRVQPDEDAFGVARAFEGGA
jgi:hypothetical protein